MYVNPEFGKTDGAVVVLINILLLLALPVTAFDQLHVVGEPVTLIVKLFMSVAQLVASVPAVFHPTCGLAVKAAVGIKLP